MSAAKAPPTVDERCGTYAGWNRHQRRGETQCGPCRAAKTAQMAEYRARRADLREQERRLALVRSRAAWRLVDRYRDEWRLLVIEELEQL